MPAIAKPYLTVKNGPGIAIFPVWKFPRTFFSKFIARIAYARL